MTELKELVMCYLEIKNDYDISGRDAAMLVLAHAITIAGNDIGNSISLNGEVATPGESLHIISENLENIRDALIDIEYQIDELKEQ